MAKKAPLNGLLMVSFSIPSTQMRLEEFIPLEACDKCHVVDHKTPDCPKPSEYKACSECASLDHTYRECRTSSKKFINCLLKHSAGAMRCPVRKRALKNKQEELRRQKIARTSTSYASATSFSTNTTPTPPLSSALQEPYMPPLFLLPQCGTAGHFPVFCRKAWHSTDSPT